MLWGGRRPTATVVAALVNPTSTVIQFETSNLQDAARSLGLELHFLQASKPDEIEAAFATLAGLRADALIVSVYTFFTSQRTQIVALAARRGVPAIYVWREFRRSRRADELRHRSCRYLSPTCVYTAKILQGAKPADLPVQQVVKLELVINLKTAKTLGLTIPPLILARADEVIE